MEQAQCRDLLQKNLSKIPLTDSDLNELSLHILNKNISLENMEALLIPDLKKVDIPKTKEKILTCLVKNIDSILDYRQPEQAIPQKEIKNDSKKQRHCDRLARILAPSSNVIPCIAVAFYNGELLIGLNTPKKKFTRAQVQEMIEKKLELLRVFLVDVKNEYESAKPLDVNHNPQFTISLQADFFVTQRALLIQQKQLGGTSVRNSIKYGITERLKVDFIKLAQFYLTGLITQGQEGFNIAECQALVQGKPNIYFPNSSLEKGNIRLHADQLLIAPMSHLSLETDTQPTSPTEIGLNKLSCLACANVLNQYPDKVTYRGTSGMSYPNTLDITTQEAAPYTPTQLSIDCLYAKDSSSSEVEIDLDFTQHTDKLITNACSDAFRFFKIMPNQMPKESTKANCPVLVNS